MAADIRDATVADVAAITAIYNESVRENTASWDHAEVSEASRRAWLAQRQTHLLPVLVADDGGTVTGWASYGPFRDKEGYSHTFEHSVYVTGTRRSAGTGTALMVKLIERAREQGVHALVGGLAADNCGSVTFHERLGFGFCGTLPQVGNKFGRWLDLTFCVLLLDDAPEPPARG